MKFLQWIESIDHLLIPLTVDAGLSVFLALLRGEERTGRDLASRRQFHRPGLGQRLIARELEIHHREIGGRAIARGNRRGGARRRRYRDPDARSARNIVAAETDLQPVVGGEAHRADVILVEWAEHIALGDVAEVRGRGERQRRVLRQQRNDAAVDLEGLGLVLSLKRRLMSPGRTSLWDLTLCAAKNRRNPAKANHILFQQRIFSQIGRHSTENALKLFERGPDL